MSNTVDFCLNAFQQHDAEKQEAVLKKLEASQLKTGGEAKGVEAIGVEMNGNETNGVKADGSAEDAAIEARIEKKADVDPEGLSPDELSILKTIRARQMLRSEDAMNIDNFAADAIDGYAPLLKQGALTLVKVGARAAPKLRHEMDIDKTVTYLDKAGAPEPITAH